MKSAALRLLAFALTAALLLPAVRADGDGWEDEGREIEVQHDNDGFEIISDRAEGAEHDRVRLRLEGQNAEFRFDFGEEGSAVPEAELKVRLERVIEFRDANGDGAFQAADDLRDEYDVGDLVLTGVDSVPVSSGGVDGLQVTADYAFRDLPMAHLAFRVTVFGNLTTFQGLQQSPVDMKMDLILENFLQESDTLPAIALRVQAEAPEGPSITAEELSFTAGNVTAKFLWTTTAEVDGVDRPVGVTIEPQESEVENGTVEAVAEVTFAYARGSSVVHDPPLGFSLATVLGGPVAQLLGNVAFYALGAVAAGALFAALAYARKGRRVKGQ